MNDRIEFFCPGCDHRIVVQPNPWEHFEPAQLNMLIWDMEQGGHGEHPMCEDAREALAEMNARKDRGCAGSPGPSNR
jgi:hypothetical protein